MNMLTVFDVFNFALICPNGKKDDSLFFVFSNYFNGVNVTEIKTCIKFSMYGDKIHLSCCESGQNGKVLMSFMQLGTERTFLFIVFIFQGFKIV